MWVYICMLNESWCYHFYCIIFMWMRICTIFSDGSRWLYVLLLLYSNILQSILQKPKRNKAHTHLLFFIFIIISFHHNSSIIIFIVGNLRYWNTVQKICHHFHQNYVRTSLEIKNCLRISSSLIICILTKFMWIDF